MRLFLISCLFVWAACHASAQTDHSADEEMTHKLWAAMSKCWSTVSDLPEPERLKVVIAVSLDRTGELTREPEVVSSVSVEAYDTAMQTAVARAVRAVKVCAPYDFLPTENYERWQYMTFNFLHTNELAIPQG